MIRSSKWLVIAAVLLIGAAGAFAALQRTARLGPSVAAQTTGFRYGRVIRALIGDSTLQEKLGLTQDQVDRIRAIATAGFVEAARLRGEVRAQKIALRALVTDPNATRTSIQEQADRLAGAV